MTTPGRDDDKDALGAFLQLALDTIVGTYEQANVDLPARRYVAYGVVAADCEQVTVSLGQVYSGTPASDPNALQRCDGPRSAVLIIQLFRKIPVASGPRGQGAPTEDALTDNALTMAKDAWLLLDAAGSIDAAGWDTGYTSEVSPIEPSGGFVGLSMTVTAQVP